MRWVSDAASSLSLSTPKLHRTIEGIVQRALLEYCNQHKDIKNPKDVIPPHSFFKEIIAVQLENMKNTPVAN
jgi:hypothetical protein